MPKYDYTWKINEEARLGRLLFRDGEPSPVAREMYREALRMVGDRYTEWQEQREAAQSKRDGDGNLKTRAVKEMEVMLAAVAMLREEESWEDMLVELPMELKDRGVKVSRNTLKRILEKQRGFIERLVERERQNAKK